VSQADPIPVGISGWEEAISRIPAVHARATAGRIWHPGDTCPISDTTNNACTKVRHHLILKLWQVLLPRTSPSLRHRSQETLYPALLRSGSP